MTELIANISAFIEKVLGRKIVKLTDPNRYTEYFDGTRELLVKNFPVIVVDSIKYNSGTLSSPSWQTIDAQNYAVYLGEGKIVGMGSFPKGYQNIQVIYNGGFDTVPDDIELIAKQLVAKAFEQRRAQGKATEALGGARIDWKDEISTEQKMILEKYKNLSI